MHTRCSTNIGSLRHEERQTGQWVREGLDDCRRDANDGAMHHTKSPVCLFLSGKQEHSYPTDRLACSGAAAHHKADPSQWVHYFVWRKGAINISQRGRLGNRFGSQFAQCSTTLPLDLGRSFDMLEGQALAATVGYPIRYLPWPYNQQHYPKYAAEGAHTLWALALYAGLLQFMWQPPAGVMEEPKLPTLVPSSEQQL